MDNDLKCGIVKIAEDGLSATLFLNPPQPDEKYSVESVVDFLHENYVVNGILMEEVQRMVDGKIYLIDVVVAKGKEPRDGINGSFEFLFDTQPNNKPKILKDGSVDYSSFAHVVMVEEGEELVRYIPPTEGEHGMNVRGVVMMAKPGKPLPQLSGRGFTLSPDKTLYTANVVGKVEFLNNKLMVSNVLEVMDDLNHVTGDIDFRGDVVIHGSVMSGMRVKASGSITVDGYVEAAQMIAGKNVLLRNGMQGGGKGEIQAGGNVSGKFFEQTTIYAKGNIDANSIMNCHIISEDAITVSGKFGALVGGSVSAISSVKATMIGNISEVKMAVTIGVGNEIYAKLSQVEDTMRGIAGEISKLEASMERISKNMEISPRPDLGAKKLEMMRMKISRDSELSALRTEQQKLQLHIEKSANAKLVVEKSIYRGTMLTINGVQKLIDSENYNSTYVKKGADITFYPNV